ncbi:hypothetical protein PBCVCviKI_626L [Paramecium bursaria Chlorella virus CviKI]|nr:hypothetical protein PBCVCviKI_626L [Paramecium bursaria Chlorella virus CviKI]
MSNTAFISQAVGRAALMTSNLPTASPRVYHLVNNLAHKANTRMLYLGKDLSYALYGNNECAVHWIDEEDTKYELDSVITRPDVYPYNFICANENMLRTSLLPAMKEKLSRNVIVAVMNTRNTDTKKIVDRSINNVDSLKIDFRLEINDINNSQGWGDGVLVYGLKNKL